MLITNKEFKENVLAPLAKKLEIPEKYTTVRQASKFRQKRGTFYKMWRERRGGLSK